MTDAIAAPTPVEAKDRIWNLDMLRGWAILGILAVNAISFAWPVEVLMSETLPPGHETHADLIGYWAVDVFFSDKFRTLFSMLFGVSIFLVGGERRDPARGPVLVRRLLWLAAFGAIHGLAFWYGDILLHYAYCGLLMMLMRSWSAKRLLWIGGGVTALWGVLATLGALMMANLPPEAMAHMEASQPAAGPADIAAAVQAYLSGPLSPWIENGQTWAFFQLLMSPVLILVTVPLMMLGLGLFKSGWFSGKAPTWTYLAVMAVGGLNLALFALWRWQDLMAGDADPTGGLGAAMGGTAPLITLFYASVLILLAKSARAVTAPLVPVGRMAFTNYLTQTLIMVSLYYMPWGPQWFGQQGSAAQWVPVAVIWIAQLIWSPLWLSRFRYGPFEWVWRRLSYGGPLPLRR